jgi:hypothetical protein
VVNPFEVVEQGFILVIKTQKVGHDDRHFLTYWIIRKPVLTELESVFTWVHGDFDATINTQIVPL